MEQMDPLAQLKDIHLPEPVGLWPLAWGWWVLLILIVLILAWIVFLWRRQQARNRYRALAIAELHRAKLIFDQERDVASYLQHVSIILRRAALTGCGDSYHANLSGEAWLQWLDNQCPAIHKNFTAGPGRVLLTGPYQKAPEADIESLHKLASQWLKQHRNQWQKNRSAQKSSAKGPGEQQGVSERAQHSEATTDV